MVHLTEENDFIVLEGDDIFVTYRQRGLSFICTNNIALIFGYSMGSYQFFQHEVVGFLLKKLPVVVFLVYKKMI
jgi:hypothetical protein